MITHSLNGARAECLFVFETIWVGLFSNSHSEGTPTENSQNCNDPNYNIVWLLYTRSEILLSRVHRAKPSWSASQTISVIFRLIIPVPSHCFLKDKSLDIFSVREAGHTFLPVGLVE